MATSNDTPTSIFGSGFPRRGKSAPRGARPAPTFKSVNRLVWTVGRPGETPGELYDLHEALALADLLCEPGKPVRITCPDGRVKHLVEPDEGDHVFVGRWL